MWESHIDFKIADAQIQSLFQNGVLKIDLTSLEKEIPQVLDALSKEYTVSLPRLFNASDLMIKFLMVS